MRTLKQMVLGFVTAGLLLGTVGVAQANNWILMLSARQCDSATGYLCSSNGYLYALLVVSSTAPLNQTSGKIVVTNGTGQAVNLEGITVKVVPLKADWTNVAYVFTGIGKYIQAGYKLEGMVTDPAGDPATKNATCTYSATISGYYCK